VRLLDLISPSLKVEELQGLELRSDAKTSTTLAARVPRRTVTPHYAEELNRPPLRYDELM
jgi:hypothetical protein